MQVSNRANARKGIVMRKMLSVCKPEYSELRLGFLPEDAICVCPEKTGIKRMTVPPIG